MPSNLPPDDRAELPPGDELPPHARKAQLLWLAALFLWMVCYVGASMLVSESGSLRGASAWATSLPVAATSLVAVFAYRRFLAQTDELHRLVERSAMELTVAVGFVSWAVANTLERAAAPGLDWSDVPAVAMCTSYALGVVLGRRRYA